MFKRIIAFMMAMLMLLGVCALAEDYSGKTTEELIAIIEEKDERIAELEEQVEGLLNPTPAPTPEPTPEPAFQELAKGAKGEHVKPLQQRLKDLGYLTGTVDGDFGGGTERALIAFQTENGLEATGVADEKTQELLFSDQAKKAKVYEKLEYKGVSRDPDEYEGRYVRFNGKVLQVIEYGSTVCFRVASRGNYDDVVYVQLTVPENYSRILEDDRVEVSGQYGGLYSYESVRGDTITIPLVKAELVTLR